MMKKTALRAITLLLAWLVSQSLWAAAVSTNEVARAVRAWRTNFVSGRLAEGLGTAIESIDSHTSTNGTTLFHVVKLQGGGLVITSADDEIEPIIAFSSATTFDADARNPLWVLLNNDLAGRADALAATPLIAKAAATSTDTQAKSKWATLLAYEDENGHKLAKSSSGYKAVEDVRVDALVQSKWGQTTEGGQYCYNYYTPSHYMSGCVATAGAQILRYHEYPKTSLTAKTYTCYVGKDSTPTQLTTKGGTYDWANMPQDPDSSITETECEAIGKLCYDVGVTVNMMYDVDGVGGSGTYTYLLASSFTDYFGFADATYGFYDTGDAALQKMFFANFDAGCPVALGVSGSGGHSIIADGYGYLDNLPYVHLNMGWQGGDDLWYNLPNIGASIEFTWVDEVVYNVNPTKAGAIVSGRITDSSSSAPIQAATVELVTSNNTVKETTTTSESGIFAFVVDTNGSYTIRAAKSGQTATQSVTVDQSSEYRGNLWGKDMTLTMPQVTVTFNPNYDGGTATTADYTVGYKYGTLPTPTPRTNYKFMGWYPDAACEGTQILTTTIVEGATTLYAKWAEAVTVTFNLNYAGSTSLSGLYPLGEPYGSLPWPTRSGYSFRGWYPDAACAGTQVTAETAASADHATLYAKWVDATAITWNYTTLSDGTVTIDGYTCSQTVTTLEIPAEIDGKTVTMISKSAFQDDKNLTTVIIPNTVTDVGQSAFYGCSNVTSLTIGSSVASIGYAAFYGLGITSVVIPASVTELGNMSFMYCSALETIVFRGTPPTVGGSWVFDYVKDGCTGYYSSENAARWSIALDEENKWYGLTMAEREGGGTVDPEPEPDPDPEPVEKLTVLATMSELVAAGTVGEGVAAETAYTEDTVYSFDGSAAITGITHETLAAKVADSTAKLVIAAWVKPTDVGEKSFFSTGGQNNGFKFSVKGGQLQYTAKGVADHTSTDTAVKIAANEWALVAIAFDCGTGANRAARFYVGDSGSQDWTLGSQRTIDPTTFAIGSGNANGVRDGFIGQIANLTVIGATSLDIANAEIAALVGDAPVDPEPESEEVKVVFSWKPVMASAPNGEWWTAWTGGADGARKPCVTGYPGFKDANLVHNDATPWCPSIADFTAKDNFTFVFFGCADMVLPSEGQLAILWSMGTAEGTLLALVKDSAGNIQLVQTNGTTTRSVSAGSVKGVHMFTVCFNSTHGASLQIDTGTVNANAAMTASLTDGFCVGSVAAGALPEGFEMGLGFAVYMAQAYNSSAVPDETYTALCKTYQPITEITYDVEFDAADEDVDIGNVVYLPSFTFAEGTTLTVTKGELTIAAGVEAAVDTLVLNGSTATVNVKGGSLSVNTVTASASSAVMYVSSDSTLTLAGTLPEGVALQALPTAEDADAGVSAAYLQAKMVQGQAVVVLADTVTPPSVSALIPPADDTKGYRFTISDAIQGLWYGYEFSETLKGTYEKDVDSFSRATADEVDTGKVIEATPRTSPSGFFRVKVLPAKPQ